MNMCVITPRSVRDASDIQIGQVCGQSIWLWRKKKNNKRKE